MRLKNLSMRDRFSFNQIFMKLTDMEYEMSLKLGHTESVVDMLDLRWVIIARWATCFISGPLNWNYFQDHDYFQEKVVHLIQASLHKLLHKTEGKQSPVFVQTIIERYPVSFSSSVLLLFKICMSCTTTKPVNAICEQQRCRSACLRSLISILIICSDAHQPSCEVWSAS